MRRIIKITVLTILGLGLFMSCEQRENRDVKLVVVFTDQTRDTLDLSILHYEVWGSELRVTSTDEFDFDCVAEDVKYVKELR